ncbi:11209_t:CDS:2 [Dentiscutata heterogama]|uniref:11209_t:CDS:1 n=1 Tax=Dentiscutata heterogama TaxID=1316150 RepID=A0ACA9LH35_9GLOM|nr:11209_t:CDS:2 [Dentiscutata heterogama]
MQWVISFHLYELKFFLMNHYSHIKNNKKIFYTPIKDLNEFENLAFYDHQLYVHAFNGSIGAPVHEKLRTGAKVLEFGNLTISIYEDVDFTTKNSIEIITFIDYDINQKLPFPDNEFDYIFSRNKTNFFTKDNFQGFLFETLRVLKPGGWLEVKVGHTVRNNEFVRGPALTLLDNAYTSWHEKYGFDPDLILNLEDHLQMIGKTESISSQTIDFITRNDHFGEFSHEVFTYHVKLLKESIAPIMGISLEEYDRLVEESENEIKKRSGENFFTHKKVLARKKDMGILKDA